MAKPRQIDRARFAADVAQGRDPKAIAAQFGVTVRHLREVGAAMGLQLPDGRARNAGNRPPDCRADARGCAALLARLQRVHPLREGGPA